MFLNQRTKSHLPEGVQGAYTFFSTQVDVLWVEVNRIEVANSF